MLELEDALVRRVPRPPPALVDEEVALAHALGQEVEQVGVALFCDCPGEPAIAAEA